MAEVLCSYLEPIWQSVYELQGSSRRKGRPAPLMVPPRPSAAYNLQEERAISLIAMRLMIRPTFPCLPMNLLVERAGKKV